MSIIKIKRSSGFAAPTALALGEFGYAYGAGTQANGGDRLYLGTGGEAAGVANAIDVVGGKYFVNLLDHVHGTLTASSAIIVDSNSKIDVLNVDNITIDGNTISSTNTNGNIVLDPDGTGLIQLNGPVEFSGGSTFTGILNADGGIAVDTSNFTVSGTTGAVYTASTLEVDGESTLASAIIEDLTATRIVYAGTGGAIVDDSGLTYTGTGATSTLQLLGNINVDVEATLASAIVEDLTAGRLVYVGTGGALVDDSRLRWSDSFGQLETYQLIVNNEAEFRGNVRVTQLTTNRVTFADANQRLADSANFTFDGTALGLTGSYTQTGTGTVTGQWNVDNLRLDGNVLSSTDTNGNITLTPNGSGYVVISGTNGLVIPSGTNAQQGPAVTGAIRYNTNNTQFEGYSGTNWSSLGGVRSVDGFTYIIAESSPAASDDILHFYAGNLAGDAGVEVAQLDITSLRLKQTTAATSTTTGALVVDGGVGIAGNLHVGGDEVLTGDLAVNGGDITTDQTTFNLLNATATTVNAFGAATAVNIGTGGEGGGTTTINHDLTVVGDVDVGAGNFTVDATTGNTETAGNMIVGGDLTVNGTTTSVNTNTLDVEDALIRLASGNTSDTVDIGFVGKYNDGADKFAGVFRDATTDEFYIFSELVDADLIDNVVDRADPSFKLSAVNVDTIKFAEKSFTLTGDVSGTINISDFGTTAHSMAVTIQPNSVELGTDTTGNYVATVVEGTGGQTDANGTTSNGIVITGSGSETAAVTVKVNIADTAGGIGTSTFDATNFDVSAGGLVTVDTIDGGTF